MVGFLQFVGRFHLHDEGAAGSINWFENNGEFECVLYAVQVLELSDAAKSRSRKTMLFAKCSKTVLVADGVSHGIGCTGKSEKICELRSQQDGILIKSQDTINGR